MLTWQTCGQRSSKAAESKRRALGNSFSERICYMFLKSKCRGDWDLGLCTTLGLAFGEPQRRGKIRFFLRRNTCFSRKSPLRCVSPNASPEVVHRSQSPLHFDFRNIQQIRSKKEFPSAWRLLYGTKFSMKCVVNWIPLRIRVRLKNTRGKCLLSAALLERWPQVCHVKITFTKLPTNRFVSTIKISMKCVVNWIQLRIRVRSRNTQPHLKARVRSATDSDFPRPVRSIKRSRFAATVFARSKPSQVTALFNLGRKMF